MLNAKLGLFLSISMVILNGLLCQSTNDEQPRIYYLHIQSDIKYRFATTLVTSKVENPSNQSKEAVFDVTLPNEAFISDFVMEMDGKIYPGRIDEKQSAKAKYEKAKKRGQSAGHVSQKRRETNRFKVQVNVAAQSNVTFNLTYEELLYRNLGTYEHVIYIQPGQIVDDLRIDVAIQESREITRLVVPPLRDDVLTETNLTERNELAIIERPTSKTARIRYHPSVEDQRIRSEQGINGLFVTEYDIDRSRDAGDLLVVDGYFVHFFAPQGMDPIPKNVLFILDVSGSMSGHKIQQVKEAMVSILSDLSEGDNFNVVKFNDGREFWQPGRIVSNTRRNVEEAKRYIDQISAGGGTNINDAMINGINFLNGLENNEGRAPVVVFLTDGRGSLGVDDILRNIKQTNSQKFPIFGLAFGVNADYALIKKVAVRNSGIGRRIYEDSDSALQIRGFYNEISSTVLQNVTFKYLDDSVDTENLTKSNFNSFYDGSEIIVAGRLDDSARMLPLAVSAVSLNGTVELELALTPDIKDQPDFTRPGDFAQITEKMWAYLTIKQLLENMAGDISAEEKEQIKQRVLQLSLKYKFVTPLTSMIVIKPEEQDVGDLDEENDPDPNRPTPPRRGSSLISRGPSGSSYGGGGGGDPHFMIRVRGLEHPVCFDYRAKPGENIRILKEEITDITINAGIIHSWSLNKHGDERTFIGEVLIKSRGMTIYINPTEILFNGAYLSWHTEIPFTYNDVRIDVVGRRKHPDKLFVDFGNDVRLLIRRFVREDKGLVNYLNVYLDEENGLSKTADGILGQFIHKRISLQEMHTDKKNRTVGTLHVLEKENDHKLRAFLVERSDIIKSKHELCWSLNNRVKGLLDGQHKDYLVQSIYSL